MRVMPSADRAERVDRRQLIAVDLAPEADDRRSIRDDRGTDPRLHATPSLPQSLR
jgi:hypothetical protein